MSNTLSSRNHTLIVLPRAYARVIVYRGRTADLEFSEASRDDRIPPGWWILPVPALSFAIVWLVIHFF
ncbi:MAG TPA: hypothetical protein VGG10_08290 [Rhizomicrobium sp.]|jgi:hypothetical protein